MSTASPETYVNGLAWLILLGGGLLMLNGGWLLYRARKLTYFRMRREKLLNGWRFVMAGLATLAFSGLVFGLGPQAARNLFPPTLPPTPSPTPSPSATWRPQDQTALAPPPASSPTPDALPLPVPISTTPLTPVFPVAFITPILSPTVTPPPDAVAADMRFALGNNCATSQSVEYFGPQAKTIYAHFYYNNWLRGVQWSGAWYLNGKMYFVETLAWDGSTGGCGFTSFDNYGQAWPVGLYEVQIFIGDRWLLSKQFSIIAPTATPSP